MPRQKAIKTKTPTNSGSTNTTKKKQLQRQNDIKNIPAPVAKGNITRNVTPKLNGKKSVRICHKEYIGDITAPSADTFVKVMDQAVNPGLSSFAPWLSPIATRYESYKYLWMKIHYQTERPTSNGGYVLMVLDSNANELPPVSKVDAMQYDCATKSSIWVNSTMNVPYEMLNKRKSYYTRGSSVPSGSSVLLYDIGNLYVFCASDTATVLGEIWIEYEVEFTTPEINVPLIPSGFKSATVSGSTPANPMGPSPALATGDIKNIVEVITQPSSDVSAYRFLKDFEGILSHVVNGTGLASSIGPQPTVSMPAPNITGLNGLVEASLIKSIGDYLIKANKGDAFEIGPATASTVTSSEFRVGSYLSSLL